MPSARETVAAVPVPLVTLETLPTVLVEFQAAALQGLATQVTVGDGYFALSNNIAARLCGREGFAARGVVDDELIVVETPWQTSLFD